MNHCLGTNIMAPARKVLATAGILFLLIAAVPISPASAHSGRHLSRDCTTWMESVSWLYWWEHAWTGGDYVISDHYFKNIFRDSASSGVHGPGAKRLVAGHNHSWFGQDFTDGFHHVHAHGIHYRLATTEAGCI